MATIGFAGATSALGAGVATQQVSRSARIALLSASEAAVISGEWRALAAEAVEDNHFFLPDVVLPATRHFGKDVRVLTVRDGGSALIALMPVTETRLGRIAPALRIWSHHYGPFGVPLVAGGDLVAAA